MSSLRRITHFLRPYRWILFIGFFTVILPTLMELLVPRMFQYIVDEGIRANELSVVVRGSLILLGAALVGALAAIGQGVCRAQVSQGVAYDLRAELFTHIQSFSFPNLDQMRTGELMTRISSDVDGVRLFFSAGVALLLRVLLMIIGSLIMIFVTDWQLALVVMIFVTISSIIIWAFTRITQPLFEQVQEKLSTLNTIIQENLAGVRVVKAFVRERFEVDHFEKYNVDYREQNIKAGRYLATVSPTLAVITNVGTAIIIWLGGLDVIGGRLSVGELIAFNNYLLIGMGPLLFLGNLLTMATRAGVSAGRILEVLDTEPLIQSAPSPHKADRVEGRVIFDQVSFHYDSGREGAGDHLNDSTSIEFPQNGQLNAQNEEVLDGITFTTEPGQRIALLGATGSGKSSLVNLIPRFYDVTEGSILIDGVDVRHWTPAELRSRIGMVLQQTILFSGTISENIAYGQPDAPLEAVIAAAKAAQAHEFILEKADGYESKVEARGANLSGGQRQRIAIARALLIAPSILILDDSTSAVDMDTEVKIQEALDSLMESCTTFIIAQRISSVLNADQILVLDAGQIAAKGSHQELMETSSIYQEIYHSQMGEER